MNISGALIAAQTAELSLAEKGISSAKVILTGFVVVFAVLLLLIAIIKIYSAIVGRAQDATSKRKLKNSISESTAEKVVENSAVSEVPAVNQQASENEIPEEVIAVIAAAVDSVYGPKARTRIKSIKKSGAGRSAWANAGVLENTRPF